MDINTLKALHAQGAIDTGTLMHFALGGTSEDNSFFASLYGNGNGGEDDSVGSLPFKPINPIENLNFVQPTNTPLIQGPPVLGLKQQPQNLSFSTTPSFEGRMGSEANLDYTKPVSGRAPLGEGEIPNKLFTDEEIAQGLDTKYYDPKTQTRTDKTPTVSDVNKDDARLAMMMRYINPLGSDLSTEVYNLGRSLGAPKGTSGRGIGIASNLGAGLFDVARNLASGYGYQKMNAQTQNYYQDLMKRRNYTNAPQTANDNGVGGISQGKFGGLFNGETFEGGGSSQADVHQQQIVQIATELTNKLHSLEEIDKYLKQQGTDEQTYNEVMQVAQQILQNPQAESNEPAPSEQGETAEEPTMRKGGKFNHKVGDKIEFTHKGKKHKGVIKKIENGQIFL